MNETDAQADPLPQRAHVFVLLGIIAIGAFLRLYNLGGACLWIDEITFVNDAQPAQGFAATWHRLYENYPWFHRSPLPVLIELAFLKLLRGVGVALNEAWYRVPMALMGVLSIPVIYSLGRRLFGIHAGIFAAALLGVSFFHVYYSREAYMYSPYYLFVLLSWYFFACVIGEIQADRKPLCSQLALYAVTTAFVLQMHMAAIFFVFAQFVAAVLSAWSPSLRTKTNQERTVILRPFLLAHLAAWLSFAPFVWIILLRYVSTDEQAQQTVGFVPFLKMIGELGWSSQVLPLTIFLLSVFAGLRLCLSDARFRFPAILCLCLGGISTVLVAYFTQRARWETRYFLVLQPLLLLLVAVAWAWLYGFTARKLSRPAHRAGWAVFWVVLLVWHSPFYKEIYALKAKLFCGRCVAEWITQNTPEGAAYVLDSAYLRREVPGFYPTPGRYGSAVPMHTSLEEYQTFDAFLRDLFRRFPDCYYVDASRRLLKEGGGFRHRVRFDNPALRHLAEAGIFPSAAFYPILRDPEAPDLTTDICYNTREDILEMKRQAGEACVALFGPEWVHCEVPLSERALDHFKALHATGRITCYGLKPEPFTAEVRLNCGSYGVAQSIEATINGKVTTYDLAADRPEWLPLGEMRVEPGQNEILIAKTIPQATNEVANFLVHEIELRPR